MFRNGSWYVILTLSGKPVFYSDGCEEEVVKYTAVLQAIVACFPTDQDLRVVASESSLLVAIVANPLILVAVDNSKRSVSQLRGHLDLLYAQILSVLTKRQLERQFQSKPSIDLRPLLSGTEVFMGALVKSMANFAPWTWLGALESLALRRSVRNQLNTALLEARPSSMLLYGLVVGSQRFIGVLRPKQHSLHPPDLHLLFNMLFNTKMFSEGEHWVPICFPQFNANGFLYAYIKLLIPPQTYIVLVSANKQGFFDMQAVAKRFSEKISVSLTETVLRATETGRICTKDLNLMPIEYFVYKSRSHVQFIQSQPVDNDRELLQMFAELQASMAAKRLRICWYKCELSVSNASQPSSILGWHTPAFELYVYLSTDDKELVNQTVKKLVTWIRKHETKLFIVEGATF